VRKRLLAGLGLAILGVFAVPSMATAAEPGAVGEYRGTISSDAAAPGAIVTYEADTGVPNGSGTITATPDVEFIATVNSTTILSDETGYVRVDFRLPDAEPGTVVTLNIELSNAEGDVFTDVETLTIVGAAVDSGSGSDEAAGDELSSTGFNSGWLIYVAGGLVVIGIVLFVITMLRRRRAGA
jgi:hypothetical protein